MSAFLAQKILEDYSNNEERTKLLIITLKEHLKYNNLTGITLKKHDGELIELN